MSISQAFKADSASPMPSIPLDSEEADLVQLNDGGSCGQGGDRGGALQEGLPLQPGRQLARPGRRQNRQHGSQQRADRFVVAADDVHACRVRLCLDLHIRAADGSLPRPPGGGCGDVLCGPCSFCRIIVLSAIPLHEDMVLLTGKSKQRHCFGGVGS